MSASLFDELIGSTEIEIDCPECSKVFEIQISQIGSTVDCPYCGCHIELTESGDDLAKAKEALDDLERTLDEF